MLKVWLYGYALGITSARRWEQRIREDLGLRYLAGGQQPDNGALSAFRRRHGRARNDLCRQVVERARKLGRGGLGMVALGLDAHSSPGFARWDRQGATLAERAGEDPAPDSAESV
jgi:hypothetical protein